MYDIYHPTYYKIGQLGCKNKLKISTAFNVYIELCEVRKLWHINLHYDEELDLIYITAKDGDNKNSQIYVPWPASSGIKLRYINTIKKKLNVTRLTIVLKSGEGIAIFYNVMDGLEKPFSLQMTAEQRLLINKKNELKRNLKKNSRNLYELAKYGDNY